LNECEQVHKTLTEHLGINLVIADASDGLKGIQDPEEKRKFIGGKFIDVFEEEAKKIEDAAAHSNKAGKNELSLLRAAWGWRAVLFPSLTGKKRQIWGPLQYGKGTPVSKTVAQPLYFH
jgi:hypothetical protein